MCSHTTPLLMLIPLRRSGATVLVTLTPTLCQSTLLLVWSSVINLKMFLSTMLASLVDILDFRFIGRYLVLYNVLI
jgi:hypothetical protein